MPQAPKRSLIAMSRTLNKQRWVCLKKFPNPLNLELLHEPRIF